MSPPDEATDTSVAGDQCDPATCDDGDPCNGVEACVGEACVPGEPLECEGDLVCMPEGEHTTCGCPIGTVDVEGACLSACEVPTAPVLTAIGVVETLVFQATGTIETAVQPSSSELAPVWDALAERTLSEAGPFRVLARTVPVDCAPGPIFDHVYEVRRDPGMSDSPVPIEGIDAWASGYASAQLGAEVDETWADPERALGVAEGTSAGVHSLGRGGSLTLTFPSLISDGAGPDLAVFENAFRDDFLELAFVEVSSDGEVFARFDTLALDPTPIDAFGSLDASRVLGVAGRYPQGLGTPFDLAMLRFHPEVLAGRVDLLRISHVRVVDVVGDGSALDSFGRPIYDPYPTVGSAGFDLDAIGVLEP